MPIQEKMSMQQIVPQEDDKKCQANVRPVKSTVCSDKKCQDTHMWPVKLGKELYHMQSVRGPEMFQSHNKQHIYKKNLVKQGSMYW